VSAARLIAGPEVGPTVLGDLEFGLPDASGVLPNARSRTTNVLGLSSAHSPLRCPPIGFPAVPDACVCPPGLTGETTDLTSNPTFGVAMLCRHVFMGHDGAPVACAARR
jgi:hypothetical protein